jgi:hypothetical protein
MTIRTDKSESGMTAKPALKLCVIKCQSYAIAAKPIVSAYQLRDAHYTDNT